MPKLFFTEDTGLEAVKHNVGADIYRALKRHLGGLDLDYVGERKPGSLYKDMLLATCLHDFEGVSYGTITELFHRKLRYSDKTIQTNVKRTRHALSQWGQRYIYWPTRAQLDRAVADHRFPEWMGPVRWWMDSTDVLIAASKPVRSPDGEWWSGKEGGPARRYMVIADGDRLVRYAWGGYSPKVYDAHFCAVAKPTLEQHCRGTSILGDTHFFSACDHIEDPVFIASPPENAGIDLLRRRGFAQDTNEVATRRAQVKAARGVVEQVFASIKRSSVYLRAPAYFKWQDAPDELDHVFYWAVGVHNKKIMNTHRVA